VLIVGKILDAYDEDEEVRALAEGIEDFSDDEHGEDDEPVAQTARVTPQPQQHGNSQRFR